MVNAGSWGAKASDRDGCTKLAPSRQAFLQQLAGQMKRAPVPILHLSLYYKEGGPIGRLYQN